MKKIILGLICLMVSAVSEARPYQSLGDLEIIDSNTNQNITIYKNNGRYYVPGEPGQVYKIRVKNKTGRRELAVVSVDGINVITGENANYNQDGYIVDGETIIDGWRKSLNTVAEFYFTRIKDSYAARTDRPKNVGVIGVALFLEKPPVVHYMEKERITADSMAPAAAPSRNSGITEQKIGTGHGDITESRVQVANFEKQNSYPDEIIAIYYDTRRNLIKKGIIKSDDDYGLENDPHPFSFVPDPR